MISILLPTALRILRNGSSATSKSARLMVWPPKLPNLGSQMPWNVRQSFHLPGVCAT
mgnify:CR=1 FL=1